MAFPGSLADILMRAGQSVAQDLDGLLRPLDLTPVQWRVLDSLSDGRGRTMSGLSARTAIQMSALSKLVDRMVVRSLVLRKQGEREQVLDVAPGHSLTIPLGTDFQFRNTGAVPLEFIIATTPPWPGENEAIVLSVGRWAL